VEAARVRYLSIAEAERLINAADPDFRPLVYAALETGARYGELAHLEVRDFNPDAGTVTIRISKTDKVRHIILTDEGTAFFRRLCAGRGGHQPMLTRADGSDWKKSDQSGRWRMPWPAPASHRRSPSTACVTPGRATR
jgi:integrase